MNNLKVGDSVIVKRPSNCSINCVLKITRIYDWEQEYNGNHWTYTVFDGEGCYEGHDIPREYKQMLLGEFRLAKESENVVPHWIIAEEWYKRGGPNAPSKNFKSNTSTEESFSWGK